MTYGPAQKDQNAPQIESWKGLYSMKCLISVCPGYLKTEVSDRRSAEETQRYLNTLKAEAERHEARKVLICLKSSVALFRMDKIGVSEFLEYARASGIQVALVSDSIELHLSHQYVECLAKAKGVNLRAFRAEEQALGWLTQKTEFSVAEPSHLA